MSLPNVLITAGYLTAITVTVIVLRRRTARERIAVYRRGEHGYAAYRARLDAGMPPGHPEMPGLHGDDGFAVLHGADFAAWQAQMGTDETEAPS